MESSVAQAVMNGWEENNDDQDHPEKLLSYFPFLLFLLWSAGFPTVYEEQNGVWQRRRMAILSSETMYF